MNQKRWVYVIGWSVMLTSTVALYVIYILATLNPNYSVTIYTNHYNEHYLELIFFILSAPAVFITSYRGMRNI